MFTLRKISCVIALLSFPYLTLADEKDKGGVCYFDPPNVQPKKAKDNQITLYGVDNFALYATLGEMYYRYKGLVVEKSSDNVPFVGLGSQLTFNIGEMGKLFLAANISKTDKGRDSIGEIFYPAKDNPSIKALLNTDYNFERTDWSVSLGLENSCFGLLDWKPLTCFMGYKSGKTKHYTKQIAYDDPSSIFKPSIQNASEEFEASGSFLGATLSGKPFSFLKDTTFNLTLAATQLNGDYKQFGLGQLIANGSGSAIGYTGKIGFSTSLGNNWTLNGMLEGFSYKLQSVSGATDPDGKPIDQNIYKLKPIEETLVAGSLSFSKRW